MLMLPFPFPICPNNNKEPHRNSVRFLLDMALFDYRRIYF